MSIVAPRTVPLCNVTPEEVARDTWFKNLSPEEKQNFFRECVKPHNLLRLFGFPITVISASTLSYCDSDCSIVLRISSIVGVVIGSIALTASLILRCQSCLEALKSPSINETTSLNV
jgi:hypothetical protein